jgi:hypothetical protein
MLVSRVQVQLPMTTLAGLFRSLWLFLHWLGSRFSHAAMETFSSAPPVAKLSQPVQHEPARRIITPEEFAEEMRGLAEHQDPLWRHDEADRLLCRTLRQLGYGKGVDSFITMPKRYS